MKSTKYVSCIAALALLTAGAQAETARLLPIAEGDLVAGTPTSELPAKAMIPGVSRDAVSFTYPVDSKSTLDAAPTPFEVRSLEYFFEVDADQLRAGATLFTTAPDAIVRINPSAAEQLKGGAAGLAINPANLVIRTAAGDRFTAGEGMDLLVDAAQMKASGVPFAAGTTAFRLASEVGVGAITVAAPGLRSNATYTVHVFDRNSTAELSMQAAAMDFFHGQNLRVEARLGDAAGAFRASHIDGFVTAPGGSAWPVSWTIGENGSMTAELPLDAIAIAGQGLWEMHMIARGERDGLTVIRNAGTSFAVHVPTAALTGSAVVRAGHGLAVELGVAVATAGRYEVRGMIFGTDAAGNLVPFAAAHSADWLDADGSLTLSVEPKLLRRAGVRAPFEVRDLRLLDQGRMGLLHRQAVGLSIR